MEDKEIEREIKKKEKCLICGKKTNKGLLVIGHKKNVFICIKCWGGINEKEKNS